MGECGPRNPKKFSVFCSISRIYKPFKCLTFKNIYNFQHAKVENVHRLWCWHFTLPCLGDFCHNKISSANHCSQYRTFFIWAAVQRKRSLGLIPVPKSLCLNSEMSFTPFCWKGSSVPSCSLDPDLMSHQSWHSEKENSDFQPKNHLYVKLFLQKTNLEQVSARLGKSAEPGLSASLEQLAFQERCQQRTLGWFLPSWVFNLSSYTTECNVNLHGSKNE